MITIRRTALALLPAAALASALVACSSSGSTGTGGSSTPTTATATVTATSSATTTAPATPTTVPASTAPTSGNPGASGSPKGPTEPICATNNLRLALTDSEGAAGTSYSTWTLSNTGSATCTMTGYVGFSAVSGSGAIVRQPAARSANLTPGQTAPYGPQTVTLIPNARAQFVTSTVTAVPAPGCSAEVDSAGVQVFPPNQTVALHLAQKLSVCSLKVGPLRSVS